MLNIDNFNYECTSKCRYHQHGNQIVTALTKRSIDDSHLAAYIAKTCRNFSNIVDNSGRSALQMCCSVDRYRIAEWLLNQGSAINFKDLETGSSALHRAIFYGCIDCAVLLLRYGANMELLDNDTRSPLQHCCKMSTSIHKRFVQNDLLVWGTNKNYNIGRNNEKDSGLPQYVDFFRKAFICIIDVSLSIYHCLLLDNQGNLYAVGHGKGGRLGIGTENSLPVPKKVRIPSSLKDEKVVSISCSKYHSLVLTNKNNVLASGSNVHKQLGIKGCPEVVTSFKEVATFKQIGISGLIRVIATDHHSIAYDATQVYVWGADYGQFGIRNDSSNILFPSPLLLQNRSPILIVESNNLGIVCVNSVDQIFVFYNYKVRTLKLPHLHKVKSLTLSGGDSVKVDKGTPSALKILMLTTTNVIFIWYENIQQYLRCSFTHIQLNQIDKIFFKSNQILILSDGDVYTGRCIQVPIHYVDDNIADSWYNITPYVNDKCLNQKIKLELNQMTNVDRVVDIFCDAAFSSFAILQESSQKHLRLPELVSENAISSNCFKELFHDCIDNGVHDIVFHVGNEEFFAHKLIIYARSPGLKSIVEQYNDINVFIKFNGLSGKMFEFILKHIYYNYFITYEDLNIIQISLGFENLEEVSITNTCKHFKHFVEKFNLPYLENFLNCMLSELPFDQEKFQFNCIQRTSQPELYDVKIKCEDDKIIEAHKCILTTRLEYFNLMFTHKWLEKQVVQLQSVPYEYMLPIIDFLYTSNAEHIRKQNYSENFLYTMIVFCDQFFVKDLQRICEVLILERISIRKCGEMLEFACSYNCSTLKSGCLQFICQNLARVLTAKSLEICEPEVLKSINTFYRNTFQNTFDYRNITPDSEAVEDAVLLSFVDNFEVDLYHKAENGGNTCKKNKTKENKFKLKTRQHEKDAILSMKELYVNDEDKLFKIRKSDIEKEAEEISNSLQSESVSWIKVSVHKKDSKRKPLLPVITPNVSNDLNLAQSLENTPNKNEQILLQNKTPESTSANRTNLNFSDFTPLKSEKLSQKQRKRLSSGSLQFEPTKPQPTKPIDIPQKPNAWRIRDVVSPPTNGKPTTFIEKLLVSPSSKTNSIPSQFSPKASSMSTIIAEEKEQREYYNRICCKSLALTQIEETAISELNKFYNVDNVDDENITIERCSQPAPINFAIWQRN